MYTVSDLTWYTEERRREAEEYAAHWLLVQQAAAASRKHGLRPQWLERLMKTFAGVTPKSPRIQHQVGNHL